MICTIHSVVAFAALLCGVCAHETPHITIDSRGNTAHSREQVQLASALMRRQPAEPDAQVDSSDSHNVSTSVSSHGAEVTSSTPEADRSDLTYSYVEEKVPGACESHYEFKGDLNNDACAQHCYKTFGCTRFSAGGCGLGCRISVPGANTGNDTTVPADGQCSTSAAVTKDGDAGRCIVYQLAFFHAVGQPGSCNSHYELQPHAKTKAACAHACKKTAGCKKFTAEPNCAGGCRISKCDSNVPHTNFGAEKKECPADKQCTMTPAQGCTVYELYR